MRNILPDWLYEQIADNYLIEKITEIRIRQNKPIVLCYKGSYETLASKNSFHKIDTFATSDLISYIVAAATKQSFYAYNNQIKQGFITTDNGIRIGLCGTVVSNEGTVSTIKNITSLNIRIARKVEGCSGAVLDLICKNKIVKNSLIISPPGAGKTTFVRDLAERLSNEKFVSNILIVDERFEIAGEAKANLIEANFIDVISGSEKHYAFNEGVKSMNPSVIITDEINEEKDISKLFEVSKSGVSIIATAHAGSIEDIKHKPSFKKMLDAKIFERIIVLSKRLGVGTLEGVFDENLKCIYLPNLMIWNTF